MAGQSPADSSPARGSTTKGRSAAGCVLLIALGLLAVGAGARYLTSEQCRFPRPRRPLEASLMDIIEPVAGPALPTHQKRQIPRRRRNGPSSVLPRQLAQVHRPRQLKVS